MYHEHPPSRRCRTAATLPWIDVSPANSGGMEVTVEGTTSTATGPTVHPDTELVATTSTVRTVDEEGAMTGGPSLPLVRTPYRWVNLTLPSPRGSRALVLFAGQLTAFISTGRVDMPLLEAILFTAAYHPFLPYAIEGVRWIPAIGWAPGRFPPQLRVSPEVLSASCYGWKTKLNGHWPNWMPPR